MSNKNCASYEGFRQKLCCDWQIMKASFPWLRDINELLKIGGDTDSLLANDYIVVLQAEKITLLFEGDFGKKYEYKFNSFDDAEYYLFKFALRFEIKELINKNIVKEYDSYPFLVTILEVNIKVDLFAVVNTGFKQRVVDENRFALKVAVAQVLKMQDFKHCIENGIDICNCWFFEGFSGNFIIENDGQHIRVRTQKNLYELDTCIN